MVSSSNVRSVGILLLPAVLATAGCLEPLPEPESASARPPARLRVAAASDLRHVLPAIVGRFEPGRNVSVEVVYGSSGQLTQQIKQGAPFDVFLSANTRFVEELAAEGLIRSDSVRPYARGRLTLAVGPSAAPLISGPADLARPEIKAIAIANPDVAPYGIAAREALEAAGLWESLGGKVVRAESVDQARQFLATGNADAAFVSASAHADLPRGCRFHEVDTALYAPLIQSLGVVAETKEPALAAEFAAAMVRLDTWFQLRDAGFLPPVEGPQAVP